MRLAWDSPLLNHVLHAQPSSGRRSVTSFPFIRATKQPSPCGLLVAKARLRAATRVAARGLFFISGEG